MSSIHTTMINYYEDLPMQAMTDLTTVTAHVMYGTEEMSIEAFKDLEWRQHEFKQLAIREVSHQHKLDDLKETGDTLANKILRLAQGVFASYYTSVQWQAMDRMEQLRQGNQLADYFGAELLEAEMYILAEIDTDLCEKDGDKATNNTFKKGGHWLNVKSKISTCFEYGADFLATDATTQMLKYNTVTGMHASIQKKKKAEVAAGEAKAAQVIRDNRYKTATGRLEIMKESTIARFAAMVNGCTNIAAMNDLPTDKLCTTVLNIALQHAKQEDKQDLKNKLDSSNNKLSAVYAKAAKGEKPTTKSEPLPVIEVEEVEEAVEKVMDDISKEIDAFMLGNHAQQEGKDISANPFDPATEIDRYTDWTQGFVSELN